MVGPKAVMIIDNKNANLGDVDWGDTAKYTYVIHNNGSDTLRITAIHPSCGCTTPSLDSYILPPAGKAHLTAAFNAGERAFGPFAKSITIYSNAAPQGMVVKFHGEVVMPRTPHRGVIGIQGIFSGQCAECHANRGNGQLGKPLYAADCAICHGVKTDGKPGPDLLTMQKQLADTDVYRTILNGKPGTNMPAFDWNHGGPLTGQEIRTLCQYIRAERSKSGIAKSGLF